MRGRDTGKTYTYAIPQHALAFHLCEEEQLRMLQTLPGFLQHCDAGARFFIDKHLSKRARSRAWFREQIKKRICANARRYGHTLENWAVDELLKAAMEYLEARSNRDLGRLLTYVSQGQDMATMLVQKTTQQPSGAAATCLASSSRCRAGLFEICA